MFDLWGKRQAAAKHAKLPNTLRLQLQPPTLHHWSYTVVTHKRTTTATAKNARNW